VKTEYLDEFVAIAAVRYSIGRQTYAGSVVIEWIKKNRKKFNSEFWDKLRVEITRAESVDEATKSEWQEFFKEEYK
jgi:hypothetical protein